MSIPHFFSGGAFGAANSLHSHVIPPGSSGKYPNFFGRARLQRHSQKNNVLGDVALPHILFPGHTVFLARDLRKTHFPGEHLFCGCPVYPLFSEPVVPRSEEQESILPGHGFGICVRGHVSEIAINHQKHLF